MSRAQATGQDTKPAWLAGASSSKLCVHEHRGVSVLTIASRHGQCYAVAKQPAEGLPDGKQARWIATALLHAERSFRRIKGYRLMPMLINGLDEFTQQEQQRAA